MTTTSPMVFAQNAKREFLSSLYDQSYSGGVLDGDYLLFGSNPSLIEFQAKWRTLVTVAEGNIVSENILDIIDWIRNFIKSVKLARKRVYSFPANSVYNIASIQHAFDGLKPMKVGHAQIINTYARQVLNVMMSAGSGFPAIHEKQLQELDGKIAWHESRVKQLASKLNEDYPSPDDLKKWAMAVFIEYNANKAGNERSDEVFGLLLHDLKENAKDVAEGGFSIIAAALGMAFLWKLADKDKLHDRTNKK